MIGLVGCSHPAPARPAVTELENEAAAPEQADEQAARRCEAIGAVLEAARGNFEDGLVEGTEFHGEERAYWDTTLEMPGATSVGLSYFSSGSGEWQATFDAGAHRFDDLKQELERCDALRDLVIDPPEAREEGWILWEGADGRSVLLTDYDDEVGITVNAD